MRESQEDGKMERLFSCRYYIERHFSDATSEVFLSRFIAEETESPGSNGVTLESSREFLALSRVSQGDFS